MALKLRKGQQIWLGVVFSPIGPRYYGYVGICYYSYIIFKIQKFVTLRFFALLHTFSRTMKVRHIYPERLESYIKVYMDGISLFCPYFWQFHAPNPDYSGDVLVELKFIGDRSIILGTI